MMLDNELSKIELPDGLLTCNNIKCNNDLHVASIDTYCNAIVNTCLRTIKSVYHKHLLNIKHLYRIGGNRLSLLKIKPYSGIGFGLNVERGIVVLCMT